MGFVMDQTSLEITNKIRLLLIFEDLREGLIEGIAGLIGKIVTGKK